MNESGHEVGPGALVIDLLGDFNRIGGREMRLKSLVGLGEELDIPGPTMRVTLARLRERGWFEVRREGREAVYRLTPACVRALSEGGKRIFEPAPGPWQGEWSMVIYTVPESDRRTRDELKKQLAWLGFGPLAAATWICPHPRLDDIANATVTLPAAKLRLLVTRTSGLAADRALAARCWDMDSLGADYAAFIRWLRARLPDYEHGALDGRAALAERVRLVHGYRRFARRDPRFPVELQPAGWPGGEARRLFEQAHSLLAVSTREHYAQALAPA